jgi:transcriptional regulator with XRE-family HTH domain
MGTATTDTNATGATGLPGLRAAREARLLTQLELAQVSGVNRSTISDLEGGVRRAQFRTIRQLAAALGVSPQELIAGPARRPAATAKRERRPKS